MHDNHAHKYCACIVQLMFDTVSALYDKSYTFVPMEYDTAAIFKVYRDADGKS